ncbi:S1 family peptidase [Govanella unica]|uniref:Serine protease n=1 Tax=Govanella unica TaxID=2975056 RepID=A0A9X3Z753_9PROT|nr:serine protease [Govania unica]MDA5193609.1 serine protease [Govania unica]
MRFRQCGVAAFFCAVLFGGALGVTGASAHDTPASADLPALVRNIKQSLVGIGSFAVMRTPALELKGTGFVVGDGRYVITNYHVIARQVDKSAKEKLVVIVGTGRQYRDREAEIVQIDPDHDLALLRMEGEPLPPALLGSGALLPEGTSIAITGFPIGSVLGVYPVTHVGVVAAITPIRVPQVNSQLLDSRMIMRQPFDVYQLDLTAFPGNSGSPLYDARTGRVEAILNSTFVKETKERALSEPTGISFAIPIVYAHQLMKKQGL